MLIALSGGVDSTTVLAHQLDVGEKCECVFFSYGQKHVKENFAADDICVHYNVRIHYVVLSLPPSGALTDPDVKVPDLKDVVGHPQPPTYVPFRNLLMASYMASYAEAWGHDSIALGVHASDEYSYWDTTLPFILTLQSLFDMNRQNKIRIVTPFLKDVKSGIVGKGLQLKVPYQLTWSCYKGGETPCHECATCREREQAFKINNTEDPLCVV